MSRDKFPVCDLDLHGSNVLFPTYRLPVPQITDWPSSPGGLYFSRLWPQSQSVRALNTLNTIHTVDYSWHNI
ncbi:hypothetical protein P168DRAFT_149043 [Aspergillus campestris IBT 28561]|uniref:Uncharacterized protein n=1 Tax=Aspergillus campestris (strain IBT 28561) TaxID=1392248 RepID=A0A2I1D611_ASPC2|nr:uncharacterized protein P168DRAFT_149043 [Aspergillus campestris IBT 28561]PKY05317.1 hypothetical protein P168DRAFT_149043 [Aspergillus campestris IBT 28561]